MQDLNRAWMFLEVARSGSFTSASRATGVPKSTLSEKIRDLEEELGVTLIARTTRSLRLTEVGLVYARSIESGIDQLLAARDEVNQMRSVPKGKIRASLLPNLANTAFPERLAGFLQAHPELSLELDFSDRVVQLLEEGFDVCVRAGLPEDSSLMSKRIRRDSSILVCSPIYAKKKGLPKSIHELGRHELVHWHAPEAVWQLQGDGQRKFKIAVKSRIYANNFEAVCKVVAGGHGISLLPREVCLELLKNERLIQILPEWGTKEFYIYIVYPAQKHTSAKLKAFLPWLESALKIS